MSDQERNGCLEADSGHGGGFDGWWEDRSVPQKVAAVFGFIILGAGLLFLFGFIVMRLWNWLMPEIFGLKTVTYWQAWGLLLLSCILFGRIGGGSSNKSDRRRKRQLRGYMHEDSPGDAEGPTQA